MNAGRQGELWVGTSGWSYPEWGVGFYGGAPRGDWLHRYAGHFATVEINATAYGDVEPEALARWAAETPSDFRFAMKASRSITHYRRLAVKPRAIAAERARALALGGKLAVVLWQLKSAQTCELRRLQDFLELLAAWPEARHAIEFRDASWFDDEVEALLARHRVASVISDARSWPRWDAITTDFVYVRLHGRPRTYVSRYEDAALADWATRIAQWRAQGRGVYVYFDNTAAGHAPADAERLVAACCGHVN